MGSHNQAPRNASQLSASSCTEAHFCTRNSHAKCNHQANPVGEPRHVVLPQRHITPRQCQISHSCQIDPITWISERRGRSLRDLACTRGREVGCKPAARQLIRRIRQVRTVVCRDEKDVCAAGCFGPVCNSFHFNLPVSLTSDILLFLTLPLFDEAPLSTIPHDVLQHAPLYRAPGYRLLRHSYPGC